MSVGRGIILDFYVQNGNKVKLDKKSAFPCHVFNSYLEWNSEKVAFVSWALGYKKYEYNLLATAFATLHFVCAVGISNGNSFAIIHLKYILHYFWYIIVILWALSPLKYI